MNWYKQAQSSFFILGEQDDKMFINNPKAALGERPGIRLKNGEIIYGMYSHWHLFSRAVPYIKNINNIESLGFVSFDGSWRSKIIGITEIRRYFNL